MLKTSPKITRTQVTLGGLRAAVRDFEEQNPGITMANYLDLFRDATGELIESAEFFEVSRVYRRLARAER